MMKKLGLMAVLVAALALSAPAAQAQEKKGKGKGGFQMTNLMLLGQKSVQEELKLSDDQVAKVKEAAEKQGESFKGLKDLSQEEKKEKFVEANKAADKAVADILKEDQVKRLKQISLQVRGARALLSRDVVKTLKITDDQKEKIQDIVKESRKEMGELSKGGREEGTKAKFTALRKATIEKAQGVLTDEQKTQWKEMIGAPFTGEIRFGRPGGGKRPAPQGRLTPLPLPTAAVAVDRRAVLSR